MMLFNFFWEFITNISLTSLNTRQFDYTFSDFQISRAPPCLFSQSLMENYGVSALSGVSSSEATVSISGIKWYVHASNAYLAQTFAFILRNCPMWTPF